MEVAFKLLVLLSCGSVSSVYAAECGDPPVIAHSTNDASGQTPYDEGIIVAYTCDPGFERRGIPSYTCAGGQWINSGDLTCNQRYCTGLTPPDNGQIDNKPKNIPGTVTDFICNTGYELRGASTLICDVDGQWSGGSVPTCIVISCQVFPEINHGTSMQDNLGREANTYGSIAEVSCNSGYLISGAPRVRCQADGTWEPIPQCVQVSCGTHPGLNSSCIESTDLSLPLLYLLCDSHGTFQGKLSSDECVDGTWSDPGMTCICDCLVQPGNGVQLRNVDSEGYLTHDTTLLWDCQQGNKATSQPLKCNNGVITQPQCLGVPETTPPPTTTTTTPPVNCVYVKETSVTVAEGQTKEIPCSIKKEKLRVEHLSIAWERDGKSLVVMDEHFMVTHIDTTIDFLASKNAHEDVVMLTLKVTSGNVGQYSCVLEDSNGDNLCEDLVEVFKENIENEGSVNLVAVVIPVLLVLFLAAFGVVAYIKRKVFFKSCYDKKSREANVDNREDHPLSTPIVRYTTGGKNPDEIGHATEPGNQGENQPLNV